MGGYLKKQTLKLAMLNLNKLLLYIVIFIGIISCNKKERNKDTDDYKNKRARLFEISQNNSEEYLEIYQMATDSIQTWTDHKLKSYELYRLSKWYLDSLICINSSNDKCVMALSYLLSEKENHDGMDFFYGAKVDGGWFFFRGANIMLFREAYGNLPNQPLKISQLQEIATKEIFRGYLKKSSTGNWEINDSFFERIEFQYEKWAYWDSDGNKIDNSTLSRDSLTKLFLKRAVYEKWKTK